MGQKRLIFYNSIKKLSDKKYLEYYLRYQLAPVIMGFKPSMTLTIGGQNGSKDCKVYSDEIITNLGLKYVKVRECNEREILFIYRECLIEHLLEDKEIRAFLETFQYPLNSVQEAILYLAERYKVCHCPHELGVFLGFDLADVKDYICGTQKKCLICGYWRVYNNASKAKETFRNYDLAKYKMLGILLEELQQVS